MASLPYNGTLELSSNFDNLDNKYNLFLDFKNHQFELMKIEKNKWNKYEGYFITDYDKQILYFQFQHETDSYNDVVRGMEKQCTLYYKYIDQTVFHSSSPTLSYYTTKILYLDKDMDYILNTLNTLNTNHTMDTFDMNAFETEIDNNSGIVEKKYTAKIFYGSINKIEDIQQSIQINYKIKLIQMYSFLKKNSFLNSILKTIPNFPIQKIEPYWFENILVHRPEYVFQENIIPLCITENEIVFVQYDKDYISLLWIQSNASDLIKFNIVKKDITIHRTKNTKYTCVDKEDYIIQSFIKKNTGDDFIDYINYIKRIQTF